MALPSDFAKIFGSTFTGGLTPIPDVDYSKGWEYVGSNPPTKNDFSYLQNFSDLKAEWLYVNFGAQRMIRITSSQSFTVPSWVNTIYVSGCAGGGGGGASLATNSASFVTGGSGGGAGQSVIRLPITVTPGQVIPVTIGTGGTGGTPATNNATSGGATQLGAAGALLNLTGGSPGQVGDGGTTVPFNYAGPAGGAGYPSGGWAQDTSVYSATSSSGGYGGQGASGPFGQAGAAGRGASSNNTIPLPGFGYGAGGSGSGGAYNSTVSAPGGAGANGLPGILIIEW